MAVLRPRAQQPPEEILENGVEALLHGVRLLTVFPQPSYAVAAAKEGNGWPAACFQNPTTAAAAVLDGAAQRGLRTQGPACKHVAMLHVVVAS